MINVLCGNNLQDMNSDVDKLKLIVRSKGFHRCPVIGQSGRPVGVLEGREKNVVEASERSREKWAYSDAIRVP
jgi:hypothetical protein